MAIATFRIIRDTVFFATLVLLVMIVSDKMLLDMNEIARNKLQSESTHTFTEGTVTHPQETTVASQDMLTQSEISEKKNTTSKNNLLNREDQQLTSLEIS